MNLEIGTEAPIFLFWEYLFQIFGILYFQCAGQAKLFRRAPFRTVNFLSYILYLVLFHAGHFSEA
jgi:hypothetical protein